jgi:acyl-CoA synthetase (AMP-forming)/AMP-acid ligase II
MPSVKPYVYMKPIASDMFELVILDGLKTKMVSNSNDPPNSLHTRDLFRRHPTIDAWYFLGRLDDRVTLSNSEKVLPLAIEDNVMHSPLVRQALVFGTGKEFPGILIFRSAKAAGSKELSEAFTIR